MPTNGAGRSRPATSCTTCRSDSPSTAFTIVDVEVVTDKSPYQICGDVAPDFRKLIGLRIGAGFHREVRARLGGVAPLHAIVELLGPVATTVFQTMSSRKARDLTQAHRARTGSLATPAKAETPSKPERKPYVIHTCHAWAADGRVVKRSAPQFFTGPDAEAVRAAAVGKKIEMDD